MSALHRARRSRSKTAPEPGADPAEPERATRKSTSDPTNPSLSSTLLQPPPSESIEQPDPDSEAVEAAAMLSAIPASNSLGSDSHLLDPMDTGEEGIDDHADNRSSSLSELGDASDDHFEATHRAAPTAADSVENDSEAETERLDTTPRKLTRTGTATSLASEQLYERTPSKLVQSTTIEEDKSAPTSPTPVAIGPTAPTSGNAALNTLSFLAASEAVSLEMAGKKRKRSSADHNSTDEPTDEPARKRSSTAKDSPLNGNHEEIIENAEEADVEEELDHAEERISALAQEEAELEQRQADVAAETVTELATVAKLTKPRKGRGRAKRKLDNAITVEALLEVQDGDGDADNDEEDSSSLDEEAAKKKNAIDELAKIEKKFKLFREKLCDEQIAQCERELEMLKQKDCQHPEYLAMIQCVDERRAGKITYEEKLFKYKLECLQRQTVAQRHQLHSQYFQTVRDLRDKTLVECNQRVYELQRGRRQQGVDEVEYALRLPEKRSERIRQQIAYNREVSILSGVAKYVGFPAAPEIKSARPSEIDDDMRAMKITTRAPVQPPPYVRPYARNTTADEVAAEEQFIEKTPWANPQHPAHQNPHYAVAMAGPRVPSQTYQTPAGQRRVVDIHALNGSASTIDALSNPPSSGVPNNGRVGESQSPVLQMKRTPGDHLHYADTPGSLPRNFASMARDPYTGTSHTLSSPAAEHRPEEQQGPRWAAMNAGPPHLPPNVGRQAPLSQRNGLGPVSVGNGAPLFGR